MTNTRSLLSWDNGTQTVDRITTDAEGNITCPNNFPHLPHSNAVWTDWNDAEVWNCSGTDYAPLEG